MPNYIQPRERSRGGGAEGAPYVSDGDPNLLALDRDDGGRRLNAYYDRLDDRWNSENGLAFVVPQAESFLPR